jgi:hypothetical protein
MSDRRRQTGSVEPRPLCGVRIVSLGIRHRPRWVRTPNSSAAAISERSGILSASEVAAICDPGLGPLASCSRTKVRARSDSRLATALFRLRSRSGAGAGSNSGDVDSADVQARPSTGWVHRALHTDCSCERAGRPDVAARDQARRLSANGAKDGGPRTPVTASRDPASEIPTLAIHLSRASP